MFIKKTEDKMGTLPLTGGAVRHDQITATDTDGATKQRNIISQHPGLVLEELQQGEEPVGFESKGTDASFGEFEEAIIQGVAWANEVPPEILRLSFSNNYSASQAAINEFKIYLNRVWADWGETFCTPIYTDWLISVTLLQKISANGLLKAWRSPAEQDVFSAWADVEWYGSIKPSTDTLKRAKGSALLVKHGWSTNAREARGTTGTKFSKNLRRLKRENEQLAEALRPMAEFEKEFGPDAAVKASTSLDNVTAELTTAVEALSDG
jgi:capsid protein